MKELMKKYSIDKNHIYGTGQSMGCMMLCELNIRYPGFFGGCFLVAGQWNPETMPAARHGNLWILVSEMDEKAFPIMGACVGSMKSAGAEISCGSWDAHSPEKYRMKRLKKLRLKAPESILHGLRETVFWKRTTDVFPGACHVKTWEKAYQVEAIREWLFRQHREIDFPVNIIF